MHNIRPELEHAVHNMIEMLDLHPVKVSELEEWKR